MTWIKIDNPATERLYDADLMESPVSFTANGTAQAPADVADALVEHYDGIDYYEKHEE